MPLRESKYLREAFCINHEQHMANDGIDKDQTSMKLIGANSDKWYALTEVLPASMSENGVPKFVNSSGIPVRVYTCTFCGYTELYHGKILNPETW